MPKKVTVRDPVLGELHWHAASPEWKGGIYFTPKHPVAVAIYAPLELEGSQSWEEALAPARAAYAANRPREWEYRLAVADSLIESEMVAGPAEEVARRLRLGEIEMYPDGEGGWRFHIKNVGGFEDFAVLLELSEEGIVDIHF